VALIEANRVKRITSTGGTLTAPANRSYRLRDIYCNPQTSNTYAVLNIAGRSVPRPAFSAWPETTHRTRRMTWSASASPSSPV